MISEIILPEIDVIEIVQVLPSSQKWSDMVIWGIIQSYPEPLQTKFNVFREIVGQYFISGYCEEWNILYQIKSRFMKTFCRCLIRTENLEESFLFARGMETEFGYDWCKFKIQESFDKYKRFCSTISPFFESMRYFSNRGCLEHARIKNWDELVEHVLNGQLMFDKNRKKIKNDSGLNRARNFLIKVYEKTGKIPTSEEEGSKLINKAIRRGIWQNFGILCWRDLVGYTFENVTHQLRTWKGAVGLASAQNWLKKEYQEQGHIFYAQKRGKGINQAIRKQYWQEFGVNTWDDFVFQTLGFHSNHKKSHQSEQDLAQLKSFLMEYYQMNQSIPSYFKFFTYNQCHNRFRYFLKKRNISWNFLLFETFGISKCLGESSRIKASIKYAEFKLNEMFPKFNQIPSKDHPFILELTEIISQRLWIEWNIFTIDDFIKKVYPATIES